jgi:hypothetical protein
MILERLVPMPPCPRRVARLGQEISHAAVGVNVVGIDPQRGFEMNARLVRLAAEEQQVRQIDVSVRIIRMVPHGFAVQRAGGVFVTGGEDECAEIVQCSEVGRRALEQFQIVALGLLELALLAQQAGALEARVKGIGVPLQRAVEFPDAQVRDPRRRMLVHLNNSDPALCANQSPAAKGSESRVHENKIHRKP